MKETIIGLVLHSGTVLNDFRLAFRLLGKSPGFAVAATLLLALGLGGNATVFALLYMIFVRPLPGLVEPDHLALIGIRDRQREWQNLSYPFYRDIRARNQVFSDVAAIDFGCFHVADADGEDRHAEKLCGRLASWNIFDVLGVKMAAGRGFRKEEDEAPGRDAVAVISYRLWHRRWQSDPNIIGWKIALNGHAFTIVGVTQSDFTGPFLDSVEDVWVPMAMAWPTSPHGRQTLEDRGLTIITAIGRLKPGVSISEARAHLDPLGRQVLQEAGKDYRNKTFRADPYSPIGPGVPADIRLFFGVLLAVAAVALLIVCANIANLVLVRSTARQREMAIRLAIGAGRLRIARHLVAETLVLALPGGALGLLVCVWGSELLPRLFPPVITGADFVVRVPVDGPVIVYASLLALLSTVIVALPAALRVAKLDLLPGLKAGELSTTPRPALLRDSLAIAQIALCLTLLVMAGLLSASLNWLRTADPKMQIDHLLLASTEPSLNGYQGERGIDLFLRLMERLDTTPGVLSSSLGMVVPYAGNQQDPGPVVGGEKPDGMRASYNIVGPAYFRTLGIPLLRGREFRPEDRKPRTRVAIVNETFARRMWPNQDPLGQTFRLKDTKAAPLTVVGVARDSIYVDAKQPLRAHYYQAFTQGFEGLMTLFVRTAGDPLALVEGVRTAVRGIDPNLPLDGVKTMRVQFESSFWLDRMGATIVSLFGGLAGLVATIGLYAVMAFFVSQRTREIGIRMALGAAARDIVESVLKRGVALAGAGLMIGMALSLAATRLLKSMLYGVTATDIRTFAGASVLLLLTALAACWAPARRAARVDPMVSLREE